jgi:Domain of unknown function (DUF5916)
MGEYMQNRVIVFTILFSLLIFLSGIQASTTETEPDVPELKVLRLDRNIHIDGQLDEDVWKSKDLQLADGWIQRSPDEGKEPTESTLVAVAYDDAAIYFAFWCFDSEPNKMDRQLLRRDRFGESDLIVVRLDPYHDHQTGYEFYVNSAGVQCDVKLFNDVNGDNAWNGVWESAVSQQPWGWAVEMRIPYHCLRFNEKDEHVWGINFARRINRKSEVSHWAFVPSAKGGAVSNYGHLTGLEAITPARHLEVLPYSVAKMETEPKSIGNPNGRDGFGNLGLDLKYGISSNLTLDVTMNPDFGQVELDAPVLNLSTYETYFPERRPFFMEGANLFSSDYTLFYSRRIGRSPHGSIDDDDHDYTTDYPSATTILGAAKITGKLSSGTSIAFLSAVTDEEEAEYVTLTADNRKAVVEPKANYTVLRIKQDVLTRSSIGAMFTLATQDSRHSSVTGGVDWRLYTNNGVWSVRGQTVFSRNDNENTGFGIDMAAEKTAGKHVRGAIGMTIKDVHLNLNRLGYLGRNDQRHGWMWMQYRTTDDWWIIRNSWNNINTYWTWNYKGENITRGWNFNNSIELTNNWYIGAGFSNDLEKYDDRETRGNGSWELPNGWRWWLNIDTDSRKKLQFGLYPCGGYYRNAPWYASALYVNYRPTSTMTLSVNARYSYDYGQTWWVDNVDDNTLFGDMNQDHLTFGFSASYMFNNNLSCQLSAQGLITSLDYYNYRDYMGGTNYSDPIDGYNYDFNYSSLNSTLLIRWEYMPGSTLYLVWTRVRSVFDDTINDFDLSRDMDKLFSSGAQNVFMIKASYWWNI